jgi:hypothetical protein
MNRIFLISCLLIFFTTTIFAQTIQHDLLQGKWSLQKREVKFENCEHTSKESINPCDTLKLVIDSTIGNMQLHFTKNEVVIQHSTSKTMTTDNGGFQQTDSLTYTYKLSPTLFTGYYNIDIKRKKQKDSYFLQYIDENVLVIQSKIWDSQSTFSITYFFRKDQ